MNINIVKLSTIELFSGVLELLCLNYNSLTFQHVLKTRSVGDRQDQLETRSVGDKISWRQDQLETRSVGDKIS